MIGCRVLSELINHFRPCELRDTNVALMLPNSRSNAINDAEQIKELPFPKLLYHVHLCERVILSTQPNVMTNNLASARETLSNQDAQSHIHEEMADVNESPAIRFQREVQLPTEKAMADALKSAHSPEEAERNVLGALPVGREYKGLLVHFTPASVDEDGDGVAAEGEAHVQLKNDEGEFVEISSGWVRS